MAPSRNDQEHPWADWRRVRAARVDASSCAGCGGAIPAGAPVYLALHDLLWREGGYMEMPIWRHEPAPTCEPCVAGLCHQSWWCSPLPCAGCGRAVYYLRPVRSTTINGRRGYTPRRRGYCSAACRQVARSQRRVAAAAAARRRACDGCGALFDPTRKDGRYCSPACKQRACRQRRAVPPA
jgi:hypothetical protein